MCVSCFCDYTCRLARVVVSSNYFLSTFMNRLIVIHSFLNRPNSSNGQSSLGLFRQTASHLLLEGPFQLPISRLPCLIGVSFALVFPTLVDGAPGDASKVGGSCSNDYSGGATEMVDEGRLSAAETTPTVQARHDNIV